MSYKESACLPELSKSETEIDQVLILEAQPETTDEQPDDRDEELCLICGQQISEEFHACLQALPSSLLTLQDPRLGMVVAEHFILEEYICTSDTSFVYKARHQLLHTNVAIKISNSVTPPDPFSSLRTNRAALIAMRLDHPNIVRCIKFEHEKDENGLLVMEWANGTPLSQVLLQEGQLAPLRAINLLEGMCDGLRYAHSQGVNHINLKPSGIMVAQVNGAEQARLLDFGVMKMLGPHTEASMTSSGHLKYASPEECSGQPPDQRSMIFSLGLILYEMLTGQVDELPNNTQSKTGFCAPALVKVRPDMPESVVIDLILSKCLQTKSARRFQSLDELSFALSDAKVELERMQRTQQILSREVDIPEEKTSTTLMTLLMVAILLLYGYVSNRAVPVYVKAPVHSSTAAVSATRAPATAPASATDASVTTKSSSAGTSKSSAVEH